MNSDQLVPIELPGFSYKIYQTKAGQTVTQDTQFLLDTILYRYANQTIQVLELGSGTGVLSILLKLHRPDWEITGIEIQPHLVELSNFNATNCKVPMRFIEGDIRSINDVLATENYDLVISNPPYYQKGCFRLSTNQEKAISRHELLCDMNDILEAVYQKMKPEGSAFLIYPSQRVEELKEKIKSIDLQFINEFSLSTMNDNMDNTVIVELAYADH